MCQGVGTFSPTRRPLGGERGWGLTQSPIANDIINEVFIKTQKDWVLRASGLVNTWRFGESGAWRGHGSSTRSPYLALCVFPSGYS